MVKKYKCKFWYSYEICPERKYIVTVLTGIVTTIHLYVDS